MDFKALGRGRQPLWLVPAAIALISSSSWVSWTIPGTTVPQSGQTLAVILVGAWLGSRLGATTLIAYLLAGGLGLPIFADGAAGWSHLIGPTAGYLIGFVVAATITGWAADRSWVRSPGRALGVMLLAHVVILSFGWSRLALALGPASAFQAGVSPFVLGAFVKSILAAGITVGVSRSTWPTAHTRRDSES